MLSICREKILTLLTTNSGVLEYHWLRHYEKQTECLFLMYRQWSATLCVLLKETKPFYTPSPCTDNPAGTRRCLTLYFGRRKANNVILTLYQRCFTNVVSTSIKQRGCTNVCWINVDQSTLFRRRKSNVDPRNELIFLIRFFATHCIKNVPKDLRYTRCLYGELHKRLLLRSQVNMISCQVISYDVS